MRTERRLKALQKWTYETICKGRQMKAPGENMDITDIRRQEPQVFLGWNPSRPDESGNMHPDPLSVCPGILIAPSVASVKNVEEKRFDRYSNIHRPQELGQWLNVSVLFSVYEPGVRLPGFIESAEFETGLDMTKIMEGTEAGLFALLGWIDDFKDALIAIRSIPDSDLFVDDVTMTYGPYSESGYIVDKRPIYYGFVNVQFQCYSDSKDNRTIDKYLI